MDSIDKHFKSLIGNIDDDGTIAIRLHAGDISAIIECLDFANMAARHLKEAELKRGTQNGVRKMLSIEKDSRELAHILVKHIDIGDPLSDEKN